MYLKGHPFYAITLKVRWKTDDKQTELKLICDFEESTYEAILIERHCMFFCMLSINKQENKQIRNKWGKNSSNFSYRYANAAHQSYQKLRANGRNNSQYCCANNVGSCWVRVGSSVQTDATTPNIVAPTMLGVVGCVLAVVCKRMQQLPTLLRQQCWELLGACWQ